LGTEKELKYAMIVDCVGLVLFQFCGRMARLAAEIIPVLVMIFGMLECQPTLDNI
jgi:uncharacterized membrane protein YeiH